ncbi:hypothetical protein ACLKA7_010077 [Drosophila subpalustris]
MSKTWPTLQLLVLVLGHCQCQFLGDAWIKSNELDVFATAPQLAAGVTGVRTNRESHNSNNNVTLAIESKDLDPPHAATASMMPLSQRKLSRGKRFVAFPLGSSASAAVCLSTGVIGNPNLLYLSFGLNWGIAYDLPNITWVLNNAHGWNTKKPNAALVKIKRRHRRNVYGNLETMIDRHDWPCPLHHDGLAIKSSIFIVAVEGIFDFATGANYFSRKTHATTFLIYDLIATPTATTTPSTFMSHKTDAALEPGHVNAASNDLWSSTTLMTMMERAKTTSSSKSVRSLSRPKRYLSFPEGSSFTVSVCFTVGIIGNPYFAHNSFGLNWGVAYDLPNNTWILQSLHGFSRRPVTPAVLRRRTRNVIYRDIEAIVDNMGYNGRDCILRTLCESRQYFQRTKLNMIGEMLRSIFSLPKQRIFKRELNENADIVHYDNAYRYAHDVDCAQQYDCQFSLLELAFGKYSTPPKNYYAQ